MPDLVLFHLICNRWAARTGLDATILLAAMIGMVTIVMGGKTLNHPSLYTGLLLSFALHKCHVFWIMSDLNNTFQSQSYADCSHEVVQVLWEDEGEMLQQILTHFCYTQQEAALANHPHRHHRWGGIWHCRYWVKFIFPNCYWQKIMKIMKTKMVICKVSELSKPKVEVTKP